MGRGRVVRAAPQAHPNVHHPRASSEGHESVGAERPASQQSIQHLQVDQASSRHPKPLMVATCALLSTAGDSTLLKGAYPHPWALVVASHVVKDESDVSEELLPLIPGVGVPAPVHAKRGRIGFTSP